MFAQSHLKSPFTPDLNIGQLVLIAGQGLLPQLIAQGAAENFVPLHIVALKDQTDAAWLAQYPHTWLSVGQVGRLKKLLKSWQATHLVLAGGVKRPNMLAVKPDLGAFGLWWHLQKTPMGDDGLLRAIASYITEGTAVKLLGADQLLPHCMTPLGALSTQTLSAGQWRSVALGVQAAHWLGRADVGQAVVVQDGFVLGVEAVEGTDALIERCADLAKPKGSKPILVKMKKPQQDMRLDLPTVGTRTIEQLQKFGYSGLAVEAGGTLCLELPKMVDLANQYGLTLTGVADAAHQQNSGQQNSGQQISGGVTHAP